MKPLLLTLAVPGLIALGLVTVYPLMLATAATLAGYGLFSIAYRLRAGRWPKGRQARPTPAGLNERERLAFYAVNGSRYAQEMCDALNRRF